MVQYESTLTDGLTCGGAYIKLLEAPVDTSKFDNESPYVLMFGPDRCGATDKVHFIVRQKNPKSNKWYEHHLRDAPRAKADRSPHLYKAVIKPTTPFHIMTRGPFPDDDGRWAQRLPRMDPDDPSRRTGSMLPKLMTRSVEANDWDEDAPQRSTTLLPQCRPGGWKMSLY